MTDDAGNGLWEFDLAAVGYVINQPNYYAYRLAERHVYIVASEKQNVRSIRRLGHGDVIPKAFHLIAVELNSGAVVQDIRIFEGRVAESRIEDLDDRGVLVSVERRELHYYRRLPS